MQLTNKEELEFIRNFNDMDTQFITESDRHSKLYFEFKTIFPDPPKLKSIPKPKPESTTNLQAGIDVEFQKQNNQDIHDLSGMTLGFGAIYATGILIYNLHLMALNKPMHWGNFYLALFVALIGIIGLCVSMTTKRVTDTLSVTADLADDKKDFDPDTELEPDVNHLLNSQDSVLDLVTGTNYDEKTELMEWLTMLRVLHQNGQANQIILQDKCLMTDLKLLDQAAGKFRFDGENFGFTVDITKMDSYDKIAERIRKNLAKTKQKLHDKIIEPDIRQMIQRIVKSNSKEMLELLPKRIHEEYSQKLINNAIRN